MHQLRQIIQKIRTKILILFLQHHILLSQILMTEPVFRLVLGDMVDDGRQPEQWEDFFGVEQDIGHRTALYAVKGDNDYAEGNGLYSQYLPKLKKG